MKVNGKDDIPYMKWKIKNVPNHQSDKVWYLQWPVQLEHHINLWSSGYTIWLWLTVCLGKIHPFLSSVNHLFRLGPSKNHGKLLVITRPGIYNKVWYLQQSWYLQYYWTVTVVGLWWSVTVCDCLWLWNIVHHESLHRILLGIHNHRSQRKQQISKLQWNITYHKVIDYFIK